MKKPVGIFIILSGLLTAFVMNSCIIRGKKQSDLKVSPLTPQQGESDFAEIIHKVKTLYGPLLYKEERFGYKFDDLVTSAKGELAQCKTDDDYYGVYSRLLSKLEDGHVSVTFPYGVSKIKRYKIPLFIAPFADNKVAVVKVDEKLAGTGISVGDEVVSVDGVSPNELAKIISSYASWGNPVSNRHSVSFVFSRKAFIKELVPQKRQSEVVFKKPDGTTYPVALTWDIEDYFEQPDFVGKIAKVSGRYVGYVAKVPEYNSVAKGSVFEFGAKMPFFLSEKVKAAFSVKEVEISEEMQKKYELKKSKYEEVYAAIYNMNGRSILLIRQPGYSTEKFEDIPHHINIYRAIMEQSENQVVGLVIDQNHNPGGYLNYATNFYRLFITQRKPNLVSKVRTDRQWIVNFYESARMQDPSMKSQASRNMAYYGALVEKANEAGEFLSPLITMGDAEYYLLPDEKYTWKKPMIILADELAGSCGDILPLLITRGGVGKMFGQRTMGLGGNVEGVAVLSASGAEFKLTRSLFNSYREDGKYSKESWVENNGIKPDRLYELSVKDLRGEYLDYVKAFSEYLLEQVK